MYNIGREIVIQWHFLRAHLPDFLLTSYSRKTLFIGEVRPVQSNGSKSNEGSILKITHNVLH